MSFVKLLAGFLLLAPKAFANPACAVCTIAIGASLEIARKLNIDDCIVGLYAGAFLALLGYWTIKFMGKKNWTFKGMPLLSMLINFSMIGFMYVTDLTYTPKIIGIFYIDPFLFMSFIGFISIPLTTYLYQSMKAKNGGHAHFPFEKVFIPVVTLLALALFIHFTGICVCDKANIASPSLEMLTPSFD